MADSKITALTALTAADPANDMIPIVDVSDTPPASGNTKRISINNILACSPSATLASATITGDLTVATSGFAVRSSDKKVFVGTAPISTAYQFFVTRGGTAGSIAQFTDGTAQTLTIDSAAGGLIVGNVNNGYVSFTANGLEQYRIAPLGVFTWADGAGGTRMTLNASGLGVGTAPTSKLTIGTGAYVAGTLSGTSSLYSTVGQGLVVLADGLVVGTRTGSDRFILDTSGNVGIGVVPSAWAGSYKALQFGQSASVSGFSSELAVFGSNCYFDTTDSRWERITSGYTSQYYQTNGTHVWRIGGTAGANTDCSFTQAMTLDASGRLITNSSTFTPPTLNTNGELNFIATSNTNVRFSYRGTDGVTRVANITLA